jgi:hypothetical protein
LVATLGGIHPEKSSVELQPETRTPAESLARVPEVYRK